MGCAHSRLRAKVDVRDLESSVRTGDIILFSSKHAAATVTKCFTASTWDHCGLVVKFGHRHVFILEYAGGVYLYPLFTRLYTYYAVQGRVICLRRLLPGQDRAEMQKKVELFVRNVLGRSPPSIQELVSAVLKQEQYLSSFISTLTGGGADGSRPVHDSLDTMFCSKLIAAIFKDIGLLAPHRASADFLPKHFSAAYDGYLDLQRGALLGPELPINFDSVSDEINALREQIAEDSKWTAEDAVRAASNMYLTMTSGLGSLGSEISRSFSNLEKGLHGYSAQAEAAMARASGQTDPTALPDAPPPLTAGEHERGPAPARVVGGAAVGGVSLGGDSAIVREVMDTQDGGVYSQQRQPPPRAAATEASQSLLEAEGRI